MDRALCIAYNTELCSDTTRTAPRAISLENHLKTVRYEGLTLQVIGPEKRVGPILGNPGAVSQAGLKDATKVFKHGWKSPWDRFSPDHFQTVKRMLVPDWAQKMLCIIVPNRPTVSPEFFS